MIYLIIALAVILLFLGFEMFLVLAIPAIVTKSVYFATIPDVALVQKIFGGIDHTTLLAIPFFVFAAHLMGAGHIAKHLTGFVRALIGHTRGGMGHTVIGGSMAFGSVSGSAPATVAAMGKMVYPEMRKSGFSEKFSLGLLVSSAETALLIPPSITLIIYGWMTGTSIAKLFAGGLAVGVCLSLAFATLVWIEAKREGLMTEQRTTWSHKLKTLQQAGWALGMPHNSRGNLFRYRHTDGSCRRKCRLRDLCRGRCLSKFRITGLDQNYRTECHFNLRHFYSLGNGRTDFIFCNARPSTDAYYRFLGFRWRRTR